MTFRPRRAALLLALVAACSDPGAIADAVVPSEAGPDRLRGRDAARGRDDARSDRGAAPLPDATGPGPTDKGTLVGQMYITYYYLVSEADYTGADDTTLYDASCKPLAKVPAKYSDAVCIEGSGKLSTGQVINVMKTCSCGRPCPTGGTLCYALLDPNKYPWGMGSKSNALVPLRSFAVDTTIIPFGTVLYAEQWDGVAIPAAGGVGGFTHDGCFRADDVGGGIKGMHFDFFAGPTAMALALEKIKPTKTYFTVHRDGGRCAHLKTN